MEVVSCVYKLIYSDSKIEVDLTTFDHWMSMSLMCPVDKHSAALTTSCCQPSDC